MTPLSPSYRTPWANDDLNDEDFKRLARIVSLLAAKMEAKDGPVGGLPKKPGNWPTRPLKKHQILDAEANNPGASVAKIAKLAETSEKYVRFVLANNSSRIWK
jgi:hypothetical protein